MKQYRVGIIGCTGMVGQRFATIWRTTPGLRWRPWPPAPVPPADLRGSGGKPLAMKTPLPAALAKMPVYDAEKDIEKIVSLVDFVFCAVNMKKEEIRALESCTPATSARWSPTTAPTAPPPTCP